MKPLTLEPEQKKVVDTEISPLTQQAKDLVVKNADHRLAATAFIKRLKEFKEEIEERFHPTANKEKAYAVYDDLLETEKAFYGPINQAIEIVKKTVGAFDTAEAKRIQQEAETAEAARKDQEEKEKAKLETKAEKAEARGENNKAEALREQAENHTVAPTFTPPPAAKKLVWKARVTNLFALTKSIAAGIVPWSVVEIRQSALNDFAKNYDGKTKIDGLEFDQVSAGRI